MQIAGSDFLFEQNNRLRNSLLDYSQKAAEAVTPQKPAEVSAPEVVKKQEDDTAASLNLSSNGARAINFNTTPETATVFAPTEFSTESGAEKAATEMPKAADNGNSVLNQYRFFVQSALYQGEEGSVRRIS